MENFEGLVKKREGRSTQKELDSSEMIDKGSGWGRF